VEIRWMGGQERRFDSKNFSEKIVQLWRLGGGGGSSGRLRLRPPATAFGRAEWFLFSILTRPWKGRSSTVMSAVNRGLENGVRSVLSLYF